MSRTINNGLLGWWWMVRRFGWRRTYRYWREGQRRGWMTREEAVRFLDSLTGAARRDC